MEVSNEIAILQEIRRPIFKRVTAETLDKTSPLYTHYLEGTLDRAMLCSSSEDAFTLAFYYNSNFDVMEYLRFLRTSEITNLSYNVFKEYLKGRTKEDMLEITAPVVAERGTNALHILRGEMIRIMDYVIDEWLPELNEYAVYGYVTIHNIFTDSFEDIFRTYVKMNPRIMPLLACSDTRALRAFVDNIDVTYDYLLETKVVYEIVPSLCFEKMNRSQIVSLLSESHINGLHRDAREQAVQAIIRKLSSDTDLFTLVDIVATVSSSLTIFKMLLEPVLAVINEHANDVMKEHILDVLASFAYIVMNHCNTFSIVDYFSIDAVNQHLATDIKKCTQRFDHSEIKKRIFAMANNFRSIARLYVIYNFGITAHTPPLEDVLDLPDRFFVLALDVIATEPARLLKEFHTNLLHSKKKRALADQIDPRLLALYLVKRNIWFEMDMAPFDDLMTDKYKMLYAQHNPEWASEHIDELRRIGIGQEVVKAISNSPFKDCLVDADQAAVNSVFQKGCSQTLEFAEAKRMLDQETDEEYENRIKSLKSIRFNWAVESQPIWLEQRNEAGTDDLDGQSPKQIGVNANLSQIYDAVRSGHLDVASNFSSIISAGEYLYIFTNMYEWTGDAGFLEHLGTLLIETVIFYDIEYSGFKDIIAAYVAKYPCQRMITNVVASVPAADVHQIIADYPNQHAAIADGICLAYKKHKGCLTVDECGFKYPLLAAALEDRLEREKAEKKASQLGDINALLDSLLSGSDLNEQLVGVMVYGHLDDYRFNIAQLLSTTDDSILAYVAKHITNGQHNAEILRIIFTRGVLDSIAATLISKLDISKVESADMNRIYSMFYIAPLNYIEYEIYKYGFVFNEYIVVELIAALSSLYDASLFTQISTMLDTFKFNSACYHAAIRNLDTRNILYKTWALGRLATIDTLSQSYFIQICQLVGNEDSLTVLKCAIESLIHIFGYRSKHSTATVTKTKESVKQLGTLILKWAEKKKLEKLIRRIYPLSNGPEDHFVALLRRCTDREEAEMLRMVYQID